MNEDVKKNLRTQGKYSEGSINRDKRHKESPENKEPPGKVYHPRKRNSNGCKEENNSFTDVAEDESLIIVYKENSTHSFNELKEVKKPTEIKTSGLHKLSETENGVSSILYEPSFFEEADDFFLLLRDTTCWNDKNIVIRGIEYPQPRLVAWYGPFPYTYSGVTLEPAEMPKLILDIKGYIEDYLAVHNIDASFNSVLLNCYRDGKDSVAWHSDDELTMAICPTIASVSLGETRKFEMRRKNNSYKDDISVDDVKEYFINLTHGSLLIMNGCMQLDWQHRVPKEYHDKPMRINLTFRTVYSLDRNPAKDVKKLSEKCSNLDAPTNSSNKKMYFNEEEFPPLSSSLNSVSLNTEEYEHVISLNVSSKSNNSSKLMEDDSNELLSPQVSNLHMSNTESWDIRLGNNLNDSSRKTEYDITNKNINLDDSSTRDSDISNADNSMEKIQSFNSSTNTSNERSYIETSISVAPLNDAQKTWTHTVYNPVTNLNSNLNVEAQVFVPISPIPPHREFCFDTLDLKELLGYNIRDISDDELRGYSYALRKKAMDCDLEFDYFVTDNLTFINDLMDEVQSLKTQRLITERMHKILCESFDELDYSGSSGHSAKHRGSYSEREQYNLGDYDNSHRRKGNLRNTSSNRDELYNRNKREYSNRGQYSREFSGQRNKNSNGEDNFGQTSFSHRRYGNFNREGYSHETFSGVEKRNSNQEEFSGKENKSSNAEDCFQKDFSDLGKRDCNNQKYYCQEAFSDRRKEATNNEKDYSKEDSSDWGKLDSNNENDYSEDNFPDQKSRVSNSKKNYNQEEIPGRNDRFNPIIDRRNFNGGRRNSRGEFSNGRRNASRGAFSNGGVRNGREEFSNRDRGRRNTSRGREYSNQEEFPHRRENQAKQEEFSNIAPRFANKEERKSSRGYSRNRK